MEFLAGVLVGVVLCLAVLEVLDHWQRARSSETFDQMVARHEVAAKRMTETFDRTDRIHAAVAAYQAGEITSDELDAIITPIVNEITAEMRDATTGWERAA